MRLNSRVTMNTQTLFSRFFRPLFIPSLHPTYRSPFDSEAHASDQPLGGVCLQRLSIAWVRKALLFQEVRKGNLGLPPPP